MARFRHSPDALPARVFVFVSTIAVHSQIGREMRLAGYDDATYEEAVRLLQAVDDRPIIDALSARAEAAKAIETISAWLAPAFDRIRAALRHHPEQARMVCAEPIPGGSLAATRELLRRIDALARGKADDHRALATLARRGFGASELGRVRALLRRANAAPAAEAMASAIADYDMQTRALRDWYDGWSARARARIKNRDHLIRLGLARPSLPAFVRQPRLHEVARAA